MDSEERWEQVPAPFSHYAVSDAGRVKNLRSGRILSPGIDNYGYCQVVLCNAGKRKPFKVHRLVADAFLPHGDYMQDVHHKDRNRQNNRAENLEWMSHKGNVLLASKAPNPTPLPKRGDGRDDARFHRYGITAPVLERETVDYVVRLTREEILFLELVQKQSSLPAAAFMMEGVKRCLSSMRKVGETRKIDEFLWESDYIGMNWGI